MRTSHLKRSGFDIDAELNKRGINGHSNDIKINLLAIVVWHHELGNKVWNPHFDVVQHLKDKQI